MFQILHFFSDLGTFCVYKVDILGWDPNLSTKLIYVLCKPGTHSLKVILPHTVFLLCLCFDCDPSREVRCGIFHLCYVSTQNFGFGVFGLGVPNLLLCIIFSISISSFNE